MRKRKINTPRSYKIAEGIIFRCYGQFGLVINVPMRKNIIINSSAAKILDLLNNDINCAGLVNSMKRKYKISLSQRDIIGILRDFKKHKIIQSG